MALREELELDVTGALSSIDRVASQLTTEASRFRSELAAAMDVLTDESVRVTADTSGLSSEVEGAVDAADSTVLLNGETRDLSGDITAGVDAADSTVTPTADTSGLTREIEQAIDAADTELDIDAGEARDQIGGIGTGALAASGAVGRLGGSLEGLGKVGGIAAAGFGLFQFAEGVKESTSLSVALNETLNRTNVIFEDLAPEVIAIGDNAAESFGLARDQAIGAAADFGDLLTALEVSREAAASMSTGVVQLAADLASFKDVDVPEVLTRIRSGLVGEIEPLRRMGISFNAAQVEAKAFELGLADVSGEISEGAKVQARFALILEQSENALGDFARTADDPANASRILAAEIREAKIAIGDELLPVLPGLIGAARDLIPPLSDLALELVPVLVAGVEIAVPILGTLADVLGAGAEVVAIYSDGVSALVGELAALATTSDDGFFGDFGFIGDVARALGDLQGALSPESLGLGDNIVASGHAVDDVSESVDNATGSAEDMTSALDAVRAALEGTGSSAITTAGEVSGAADRIALATDALRDAVGANFGLPRARFDFDQAAGELANLGDGGTSAARGISAAERALADFTPEVVSAEDVVDSFSSALDDLLDREFSMEEVTDQFTQQIRQFAQRSRDEGFAPILEGTSEAAVTNREAFRDLVGTAAEVIETAREQGVTGEELNDIVDEQEAKILALADALGFSEDETAKYTSVLEDVIPVTEKSEKALRDRVAAENAQARAELEARVQTEQTTRAISNQTQPARDNARALFDLAESAADVAAEMLEADEPLGEVLDELERMEGITVNLGDILELPEGTIEDIEAFFDDALLAIGEGISSVEAALASGLLEAFDLTEDQKNEVKARMSFLGETAMEAIKAVLGIASPSQEAIEIGEEFIAGLIEGLDPADVDDLAGPLEAMLEGLLDRLGQIGPRARLAASTLRDEIAEVLTAAAGLESTMSLDDLLSIISGEGLESGAFGFDEIFEQIGILGERAGEGFRAVDETLEDMRRRRAGELAAEAHQAEEDALEAIDDLGAAIAGLDLNGLLDEEGRTAGAALLDGLREALTTGERSLIQEVAEIGVDLIAEFRSSLGIESPSKLTREIGHNLVAGLADGLGDDLAALDAVSNLSRRVAAGMTPAIPSQNAPGGPMTAILDAEIMSSLVGAIGSVQQPLIGTQVVHGGGGAHETASAVLRKARAASFRKGRRVV